VLPATLLDPEGDANGSPGLAMTPATGGDASPLSTC